MGNRVSFHISTLLHENPIPNVTRKGSVIVSSGIFGFTPEEGKKGRDHQFPEDIEAECRQMLVNMRTTVEAAGGTIDDIIKVDVFMLDRAHKKALNGPWAEIFPDPNSQPVRGTSEESLTYGRVRCQFMAVVAEPVVL